MLVHREGTAAQILLHLFDALTQLIQNLGFVQRFDQVVEGVFGHHARQDLVFQIFAQREDDLHTVVHFVDDELTVIQAVIERIQGGRLTGGDGAVTDLDLRLHLFGDVADAGGIVGSVIGISGIDDAGFQVFHGDIEVGFVNIQFQIGAGSDLFHIRQHGGLIFIGQLVRSFLVAVVQLTVGEGFILIRGGCASNRNAAEQQDQAQRYQQQFTLSHMAHLLRNEWISR